MIALPLAEPGVNAIEALALPAVADSDVGASGTVAGVTLLDAADAAVCQLASLAFEVNV